MIGERVLPLKNVVVGDGSDAMPDVVVDVHLRRLFLRLSSAFSTSEVSTVKVDEDHDEAAEDDGGRAEVVAGPAAVAGVDVA